MKIKLNLKKNKLKDFLKEKYNISINEMQIVPLGINCYSYIIKDINSKKYFLKVLINRNRQEPNISKITNSLRNNLFLMLRCKLDFISYPILTTKGDYLSTLDNHTVIIYDYAEGRMGDWKFNPSELQDLGIKLARLHSCNKLIEKEMYPKEKINIRLLELRLEKHLRDLEKKANGFYLRRLKRLIMPKKDQLLNIIKELKKEAPEIPLNNKLVLTHGDAVAENLLIHNNSISIIDLDDLAFAPMEKDTWLYVANDFYKPFMKGYNNILPKEKPRKKVVLFYYRMRIITNLLEFIDDIVRQKNRVIRKAGLKKIKSYILFELNRMDERTKEIIELL